MPSIGTIKQFARILRAAVMHDRPVYAHFGITHRCDLRCRMCGIWKHGNQAEELNVRQIAQVADVLQDLGVVQLSIGGGEPFYREDLAEVIDVFSRRRFQTRVLTNAMNLTEARIREVVDAGLSAVSVSLDTLSRKRFAWVCRVDDAWDKVVTNLVRFARLLPRRGAIQVINVVVSHDNLAELPDMVRFAEQLGYFVSFLPVELAPTPQDFSNDFVAYQPQMGIRREDWDLLDRVYDTLIIMKRRGAPILSTTPFLAESRGYLKRGTPRNDCDAGTLYFSISPAGRLSLCHRGPSFRSMLEPDIADYIRSRAFRRNARREVARCSGCIRPCWKDTSKIFHTPEGFLETVWVSLRAARQRPVPDLQQALAWGRP